LGHIGSNHKKVIKGDKQKQRRQIDRKSTKYELIFDTGLSNPQVTPKNNNKITTLPMVRVD
jgi:hypothetical protein